MDIQENIVNKVAQSGLVTLDPAAFYPTGERVIYDIKDNLYMELMLREKDFRAFMHPNYGLTNVESGDYPQKTRQRFQFTTV